MKYTFRRLAGLLCITLATIILARFMPISLWYILVILLVGVIAYLLYVCFY